MDLSSSIKDAIISGKDGIQVSIDIKNNRFDVSAGEASEGGGITGKDIIYISVIDRTSTQTEFVQKFGRQRNAEFQRGLWIINNDYRGVNDILRILDKNETKARNNAFLVSVQDAVYEGYLKRFDSLREHADPAVDAQRRSITVLQERFQSENREDSYTGDRTQSNVYDALIGNLASEARKFEKVMSDAIFSRNRVLNETQQDMIKSWLDADKDIRAGKIEFTGDNPERVSNIKKLSGLRGFDVVEVVKFAAMEYLKADLENMLLPQRSAKNLNEVAAQAVVEVAKANKLMAENNGDAKTAYDALQKARVSNYNIQKGIAASIKEQTRFRNGEERGVVASIMQTLNKQDPQVKAMYSSRWPVLSNILGVLGAIAAIPAGVNDYRKKVRDEAVISEAIRGIKERGLMEVGNVITRNLIAAATVLGTSYAFFRGIAEFNSKTNGPLGLRTLRREGGAAWKEKFKNSISESIKRYSEEHNLFNSFTSVIGNAMKAGWAKGLSVTAKLEPAGKALLVLMADNKNADQVIGTLFDTDMDAAMKLFPQVSPEMAAEINPLHLKYVALTQLIENILNKNKGKPFALPTIDEIGFRDKIKSEEGVRKFMAAKQIGFETYSKLEA
ncbi:MAG TPA: hypothetical protein PK562_06405, partial [Candidatus Omnitrophota bacterium]|nr:hypothetical protein [Candidatus Omnitrophota bacterium]